MSLRLPDSMPWRIYQAYLQGPGALLRLFEDAFGCHALCGPPEPDKQQHTIDARSAQVGQLKAQVGRLQAEVSDLLGRNFQLQRRNAELEALAVKEKDSHNSSRPPSTDPPWAKRTRSLRRPSGKRPGGQVGHRSETLRLTPKPQRVITHRPKQCRHCLSLLGGGWSAGAERRQVIDLVPARLRVTEHRAEVVCCPACGKRTKAEFPEGVRATMQSGPSLVSRALYLHDYQLLPYQRTAEAMRELFGCALSAGTLATAVRR